MDYKSRIREIVNHATGHPDNWCSDDCRVVGLVDAMSDEIDRLNETIKTQRATIDKLHTVGASSPF